MCLLIFILSVIPCYSEGEAPKKTTIEDIPFENVKNRKMHIFSICYDGEEYLFFKFHYSGGLTKTGNKCVQSDELNHSVLYD